MNTWFLAVTPEVLLAGGAAENIGVGQTYTAELYDPQSHTFDGFGSMDIKRAKLSALELDSEKVVIAGNWLHDDAIEQFGNLEKYLQYEERYSRTEARSYSS